MSNHPQNENIRLLDGDFYARRPHAEYAWMRENAPVYWDEGGKVWGAASYEHLLAIEKDPETFCNSGGIRPDAPAMPQLIDLDDPEHKKRRNLVNKGFSVKRVQDREPRIREICVELTERCKKRGEFDFVMDLAAWLPLITIGDMLGVDPDHYDDLLRWSDDMVKATGAATEEMAAAGTEAFIAYDALQRKVIADRRARTPQEDLVSVLVNAEIDGEGLSDDDILWDSLLILIGGDETTRHVITEGMYQLLLNPDQMQDLQKDRSLLTSAIEEMLRWTSPIKNMARTATRDVEIAGETIREGDKLVLLYESANQDPARFDHPERFDIRRTPNEHIAFGFGSHFCMGASLARLELRVLFEEVLDRLPKIRLVETGEPERRSSNFISGIEHLKVAVN